MKLNRIALFSVALALMVLTVPFAFGCSGKVTGGGQCITGSSTTIPAASFGFNAMVTGPDDVKGELNYVDHVTLEHFHMHIVTWLDVTVDNPPNKPWPMRIADFEGPCLRNGEEGYYAYVRVQDVDRGEPGTKDMFFIRIYEGKGDTGPIFYEGGSLHDPILAGNIQIHKPPYP